MDSMLWVHSLPGSPQPFRQLAPSPSPPANTQGLKIVIEKQIRGRFKLPFSSCRRPLKTHFSPLLGLWQCPSMYCRHECDSLKFCNFKLVYLCFLVAGKYFSTKILKHHFHYFFLNGGSGSSKFRGVRMIWKGTESLPDTKLLCHSQYKNLGLANEASTATAICLARKLAL